ncbi:hypothetical protein T4A_349 [Trichinella pseudospiralis]|uniref:Uncharacterized protein n=1 Tax=Trichinella pseudospiralis TaxID=6337 RepID=A0A0V1EWR8_TRIPS|nr:hypothetical protein T4A_349 [Trichinella pseudospiralis]
MVALRENKVQITHEHFLAAILESAVSVPQFENRQKVCMFAVDLQVQCKVVSAYGTPCHNRRDNDLTKLGGYITATNAKIKKIKTLDWRERRHCKREVGLQQSGPANPDAWFRHV